MSGTEDYQDRDRQTKTLRNDDVVHESGKDKRFVASSKTSAVHKRAERPDGEGYTLDPVCGQTLPEGSLWGGFDAETPEEVARKYDRVNFCTKCFNRSLILGRIGREAREERKRI